MQNLMQVLKTINRLLILLAAFTASTPVLAQYDFTVSSTEGCTPFKVKYSFVSAALVDSVTGYTWDFDNGTTSSQSDPDTVVYNDGGLYNPTLHLSFTNGTEDFITKPGLLTVHRTVPADFSYYDTATVYTYVFEHTEPLDNSVTYSFDWDFEGVGTRTGRKQIITFPSVDTFQVTLTVSDNFGCTSTSEQTIIIESEVRIQNVFTPNGDNVNDFFIVTSSGGFPLEIEIYTRAGILVYKGEGSTIAWDGRTSSGSELNAGVYFYTLRALSGDPGKHYTKAGFIYICK